MTTRQPVSPASAPRDPATDRLARVARAAVLGTCATFLLLLSPAVAVPSEGLFTSTNPNSSVLATATLQPPTGVGSTATTMNSIDLAWTRSSSAFAVTTELYRGTASGGPYALVTTLPANTTSYSDGGLVAGTLYYYVLRSLAQSWTSAYSTEFVGVTDSPPPPPPPP